MSSSPLIEVVFEVRFKPKNNFATELLIAINQLFGNHISVIHADGLQFPAEIKAQQPDLYY
ncbi:TIGR04255 family protein, partial [Acinetobacter baumannii]|nr:TIGR04255 family protein [Acinetobacter baumannii]